MKRNCASASKAVSNAGQIIVKSAAHLPARQVVPPLLRQPLILEHSQGCRRRWQETRLGECLNWNGQGIYCNITDDDMSVHCITINYTEFMHAPNYGLLFIVQPPKTKITDE